MPSIHPEEIDDINFDEIIDVRSAGEFAEDFISGAINLPVLDDSQRSEVGEIYKQISPFDARRMGAGLVSANIAAHLTNHFHSKPKSYMPLIYCWRGGQRSISLATVLSAVGWKVHLLSGGYGAYRKYVSSTLGAIMEKGGHFRVIAGLTGTGKTLLLKRLSEMGQQVVDLEGLACHRGSALGHDPLYQQPTQKRFENILLERFAKLDLCKPIYLESESSRIGDLQIHNGLWAQMKNAPVIELDVPLDVRADYLLQCYSHFTDDPVCLLERLAPIRNLRPAELINKWEEYINKGDFEAFVRSILQQHYDPAYAKSRKKTFTAPFATMKMDGVSADVIDSTARGIVELERRLTEDSIKS
ncbi:MAG: tRNA 2-selenouridine(34) synthase MnmH [Verrucomicrobiaceae bacterium]|nr:tRNA 2-selenouridine(34) synthase MnmH [Verrucomicrobiaceae bacterium]